MARSVLALVPAPSCASPLALWASPFSLTVLAAALLMTQAPNAQAQSAADLQRIERIQQEEQQRQLRELEQQRERARPPTSLDAGTVQRPATRPEGPCRDIREIKLKGANALLASTRDSLLKPYVGRCLSANDIERLMGDLTAHYVSQGRITARVYLGAQDLSTGTLELTVVEGVLKQLRIEDGGKKSISPGNVFPGVEGKPLNLRDIEQGLDQINRLGSNNATMSIEPGEQPGESILVVRNTPVKAWRVSGSVDNFGSQSTGRNQAGLSASYDNPLGFNDFISVTDRRTLDRHDKRRDSQSNSLTYSIPYGALLFTVGASKSSYFSTLVTPGGVSLPSEGDSTVYYARGDYTVYRDRDNLVTLSGTLTRKSSKNYLASQYLEVSSRSLTVLDIDLALRRPLVGGIMQTSVGLSDGKRWFGALKDPSNAPDWAPQAQFTKVRASASWATYLPVGTRTVDFSSSWNGQYANDVMYGSEQMLVGGIYSVRGYDKDTLANDRGWVWRNEIGVRSPFELKGTVGSWRPYAALDGGCVYARQTPDVNGYRGDDDCVTGGALGLQLRWGPATLDTFVMKPLKRPDHMNADGTSVRAVVSLAF